MAHLTPIQRKLVEELQTRGKGQSGKWVRGLPIGVKTLTINSLLRRDIIEQRFVRVSHCRYPKVPKGTTGFWQELRIKK